MTPAECAQAQADADHAALSLGRLYAQLGIVSATVRPTLDGLRLSAICPDMDRQAIAELLLRGILSLGLDHSRLAAMLLGVVDGLDAVPRSKTVH